MHAVSAPRPPVRKIAVAWTGSGAPLSLDCMISQDLVVRSAASAPAPLDRGELELSLRPFGESRMLPRAGDQRAEATGEGGVLLVRGEDGELRAFANSCRHRGHELLPCGQAAREKAIICPYHAWTYSLAGELRAAAGFRKQGGFDTGQWGLAELPAAEWHGLVFVDGSGGSAGSLADALAKLDELAAPYEPERLVTAGRHRYDTAANWKILAENYH